MSLNFCILASPRIFPLQISEYTLFLTLKEGKIIIYRLDFQICDLCFVSVFLQRRLFDVYTLLFAHSASLMSSRHPLIRFCLPSASCIQYIYLSHQIMIFYITSPFASYLSSLSFYYSTLLPIGPSCLHILLCFYCHVWLSHFCHYLVNPRDICLFIFQIWLEHSEDGYFSLGSTPGILFFYRHIWFSHFRHYLVNQRDLRLYFLLIWQKHSVGNYLYQHG